MTLLNGSLRLRDTRRLEPRGLVHRDPIPQKTVRIHASTVLCHDRCLLRHSLRGIECIFEILTITCQAVHAALLATLRPDLPSTACRHYICQRDNRFR